MFKIINFDTLPSTNKYLKEQYNNYDEFTVVITDNQTNGKGRMARVWDSTSNSLTFSILLKPTIDSNKIANISLVAGASICKVINKYIPSLIKWPNDIIVNNKKLAGILVEGVSSNTIEAIVVGIGINVNDEYFSDDLLIKATSLKKELNKEINKQQLLQEILNEFYNLYIKFINNNNEYLDICINNNYLKNKTVYLNNESIKVLDITSNGNLLIEDSNKNKKELYFGEVTLNKIYQE